MFEGKLAVTRSAMFGFGAAMFAAAFFLAPVASLADTESRFMSDVAGRWSGPGEIVAGKYKGTKFVCDLKGLSSEGRADVDLDGTCRVGVFSQPMQASVKRSAGGFSGKFLDGAKGKGLDIVSGSVSGEKAVFGLKRDQLNGAMLARLAGRDALNVTISVKVEDSMVPVIAMNLKRVDQTVTSGTR